MKNGISVIIVLLLLVSLFKGCLEKKDSLELSTHPTGWMDKTSENFHGTVILSKSMSLNSCETCHGDNTAGTVPTAELQTFCFKCHALYPHPQNFADPSSPTSHDKFIATVSLWNIVECRTCHGDDYAGKGWDNKNCNACHTQPGGPEACNTCHGSNENSAPPVDMAKNTSTNFLGVGAHQSHLVGDTWSVNTQNCFHCHVVPVNYDDPGHVDNVPLPAEVVFSAFASDSGNTNPVWNRSSFSCSDVYCHGAFVFRRDESANPWAYVDSIMVGNNPNLIWNAVGAGQALCGTCHSLPPQGHNQNFTQCSQCHSNVVNPNLEIINKDLHINGKADL